MLEIRNQLKCYLKIIKMLDINILQNSWHFKERILDSQEYLFLEWENDDNIYIILNWELIIEKYTDNKKNEAKKIATLKKDDVFWEASLNNNFPKQVSIKAKTKTKLLYINANKWIDNFSKKYQKESFNLLKYIIHLSNNRLNSSNTLITYSYKISDEIIKLKDFSYKSIFKLIDKIKEISPDDEEIIYLEENPIIKEYLTIKYKTEQSGKMQDEIIKVTDNKLDLLQLEISWKYNYTQSLKIWEKNYWYLIFIRTIDDFTDNEKKIYWIISTSLAWVLKQKELIDEQINKEYMKNN